MTQSAPLVSIIGPMTPPQKRRGRPLITSASDGRRLIRELNAQQGGLLGVGFTARRSGVKTLVGWRNYCAACEGDFGWVREELATEVLLAMLDEAARLRVGTQLWLTGIVA